MSSSNINPFQDAIKFYNKSFSDGEGDEEMAKPSNFLREAYLASVRKPAEEDAAAAVSIVQNSPFGEKDKKKKNAAVPANDGIGTVQNSPFYKKDKQAASPSPAKLRKARAPSGISSLTMPKKEITTDACRPPSTATLQSSVNLYKGANREILGGNKDAAPENAFLAQLRRMKLSSSVENEVNTVERANIFRGAAPTESMGDKERIPSEKRLTWRERQGLLNARQQQRAEEIHLQHEERAPAKDNMAFREAKQHQREWQKSARQGPPPASDVATLIEEKISQNKQNSLPQGAEESRQQESAGQQPSGTDFVTLIHERVTVNQKNGEQKGVPSTAGINMALATFPVEDSDVVEERESFESNAMPVEETVSFAVAEVKEYETGGNVDDEGSSINSHVGDEIVSRAVITKNSKNNAASTEGNQATQEISREVALAETAAERTKPEASFGTVTDCDAGNANGEALLDATKTESPGHDRPAVETSPKETQPDGRRGCNLTESPSPPDQDRKDHFLPSFKLADEVVLDGESLEFNRSLLEKKEQLRKHQLHKFHKLESERRRSECKEGSKSTQPNVAKCSVPNDVICQADAKDPFRDENEKLKSAQGSAGQSLNKDDDFVDVPLAVDARAEEHFVDEEAPVLNEGSGLPKQVKLCIDMCNKVPLDGSVLQASINLPSAFPGKESTLAKKEARKSNLVAAGLSPKSCLRRREKCRYFLLAVTFAVGVAVVVAVLALGGRRGGAQIPPTTSDSSASSPSPYDQADTSPFPYAKPTFRYEPFHELDTTVQNIAVEDLGYLEIAWNTHGLAPIEQKGWRDLTTNERDAVNLLGFTADTWDCFIHHYDSYAWVDLTEEAVQAYTELGWTQEHWDDTASGTPSTESKWWDLLTNDERGAANYLCYFEDNWDKIDMNPNPSYFPHPVPVFRYRPWDELDAVTRQVAAGMMGYMEESWNGIGSSALEKNTFLNLEPEERAGAMDLGFYTHTWDCYVNHYASYYWSSLHGDLKLAVETLGWDKARWTGASDQAPESEYTAWMYLTAEERAAATRLCYFEEVWDGAPITSWYNYDAGENTAVVSASDGPLPKDVNLHIFDETGYAGRFIGGGFGGA